MSSSLLNLYDPHLLFLEEPHKYYWCGYPMRSATEVVELFSHAFEAEKTAASCAEKRGVDPQSLLDEWKAAGDHAAELGTAIHAFAEQAVHSLHSGPPPLPADPEQAGHCRAACAFLADHMGDLVLAPAFPELRICLSAAKIAGMIDLLAYINGAYHIIDYKSVKQLLQIGHQKMYAPFNHLPDTNFWHYSLQLSIYEYILEQSYGMEVAGRCIIWTSRSGKYEMVRTPSLRPLIPRMLKLMDGARCMARMKARQLN